MTASLPYVPRSVTKHQLLVLLRDKSDNTTHTAITHLIYLLSRISCLERRV